MQDIRENDQTAHKIWEFMKLSDLIGRERFPKYLENQTFQDTGFAQESREQ